MFDSRWRKAWRDLWLQRARSLLVIGAVAIGLTGAGTVLDTWALLQRATTLGFDASLPVSATLTVSRLDDAVLASVHARPEIAAVRARRTVAAAVQAGGTWRHATLYSLDDFDARELGRLAPESGDWPPRDGQILIETSSLTFSGASIGDSVMVKLGDGAAQSLNVSGSVRDVSLAPGWMEHEVYGFASAATLTRLGAAPGFDEVQLRVRDTGVDRAQVRRIANAIQAQLESAGVRVSKINVPVPGEHVHAAQMDSLLLTQGAFALLSLLVCAFLIVNLTAAMLHGQARQIGVMKTLGASAAQIASIYLGMALAMGVLASALALPAALLLARPYAGMKAELLNFPLEGISVPAWAIVVQLIVGCLLPVAAAALPVLRACRGSVGAALRDIGIVAPGAAFSVRRLVAPGRLSRPLLLALGNAFRRRQRMLLTLLALATGGAVFLGAANLRESVIGSVALIFETQRFDFVLRFADSQPAATLEALAAGVDGVTGSEAWRSTKAVQTHADGSHDDPFTLVGLPPASPLLQPVVSAGRWLLATDDTAIVVSRRLAKDQPGLTVGAAVDLNVDGKQQHWTIVGIVDAGPQSLAYVPRTQLNALNGNELASSVVIATGARSLPSQLDVIARLRTTFEAAGMPVASSQSLTESRRVLEDHLLMVVDFLGLMGWVMLVVGGIGLASTMSMSVLERTREIGVMRAIGARHGTIQWLLQFEALVIAGLSCALALPLSVPMSLALGDAFGRVMFTVPTHYVPNAAAALTWVGLSAVISVLACAWPARVATRISARAALSYE